MILMDELIRYLIPIIPTTLLMIGVFLYLVIFKIEKLEIFASKVCSFFSFIGTSFEKKSISKEIRGRIIEISKEISKGIDGILPYDLKIEWVKETTRESFFNNNQIIIRMSQKDNKTKNIAYAVHSYVNNGLLPKARRYYDRKVIESSKLAIMRKLIIKGYPEIFDYFCQEYIDPITEQDIEIKEYLNQIIRLDENGMFVQVLLREFIDKANLIFPQEPDESLKAESKEFLRFLYNIASKEKNEDVPLTFNGVYFKTAIIIVAKTETIGKLGFTPYLKRIFNSLEQGIETIYIFAIGSIKSQIARSIAEIANERDYRIRHRSEYVYKRKTRSGRQVKSMCVVLDTKDKDLEEAL